MSFPACVMLPEDWGSSPAMALKSVVFPHPDGPRKQMNSPLMISNESSRTATNSPKCLVRFSMYRYTCFDSGMYRFPGRKQNPTRNKGGLKRNFRLCPKYYLASDFASQRFCHCPRMLLRFTAANSKSLSIIASNIPAGKCLTGLAIPGYATTA